MPSWLEDWSPVALSGLLVCDSLKLDMKVNSRPTFWQLVLKCLLKHWSLCCMVIYWHWGFSILSKYFSLLFIGFQESWFFFSINNFSRTVSTKTEHNLQEARVSCRFVALDCIKFCMYHPLLSYHVLQFHDSLSCHILASLFAHLVFSRQPTCLLFSASAGQIRLISLRTEWCRTECVFKVQN